MLEFLERWRDVKRRLEKYSSCSSVVCDELRYLVQPLTINPEALFVYGGEPC